MNRLLIPSHLEIVYLEADINYTIFHLKGGEKFVSSFTLKKYEVNLKEHDFLRISKSSLINPAYIKHINRKGRKASIELVDGTTMNVARRRINNVKNIDT